MQETFGQRFTRLRKGKGLTQEDIGTRLNISAQAVSKWENDLSEPDITLLLRISDILGVSIDELCGKEKSSPIMVMDGQKKNLNKLMVRLIVNSQQGDKVRINLPMPLIKVCVESGMSMPQVSGNETLKNIDFRAILNMVEQGILGQLLEVESADGDTVSLTIEEI